MTSKILQDYGVQPNEKSKDESVVEFLERRTWFYALTKVVQKHSEFMQPWKDDYPRMEYAYPDMGLLPLTNLENSETVEFMPRGSGGDDEDWPWPECPCCFYVIWKECTDGKRSGGRFPVVFSKYPYSDSTHHWILEGAYKNVIESKPSGTGFGSFLHSISFEFDSLGAALDGYSYVNITYIIDGVCGHTAELWAPCLCCVKDYVTIALDSGSTDDTIDSVTPAVVTITDGCPPYTWAVAGLGYSIVPDGESASLTATVSVVGGTCGVNYDPTCTVTVTDDCGNAVTKTIRNVNGQWTSQGNVCGMSAPYDTSSWNGTGYDLEKVSEDQRQLQTVEYEGHCDADQCTGGCGGVTFEGAAWCDFYGYQAQGVCIWNSTWCVCHPISSPCVGCDSHRTQTIEHFHWTC